MSVTVAVVNSRVEAEMIVGMLRSHGLFASVSADDAGGVDPALQAQGVRVLVPDAEAAEARRLLNQSSPDAGLGELNFFQRWIVRVLDRTGATKRKAPDD